MTDRPILKIINETNGEFGTALRGLQSWEHYTLLLNALEALDRDALYDSRVHGVGHIERTILHGGMCCMDAGADASLTALVLDACSYHDVGRRNDSVDPEHGYRSSLRLEALTDRHGDALNILKASVTAHSRDDGEMHAILDSYPIENRRAGLAVSELLKDADGLDRIRINDLDPRFLRREESRRRVAFSKWVFQRYQECCGLEPVPMYPTSVMAMIRSAGFEPTFEELWDMTAFRALAAKAYNVLCARGETPELAVGFLRFFRLGQYK